jgi:hypothetical protein
LGSPVPGKRPPRDGRDHYSLDSTPKDGEEAVASKKLRTERRTWTSNPLTYHEFMKLDQAGPAVMGCDNTRECNLVAIKRLKGVSKASKPRIQPFTSNQVVELKDMFFDNDDLVIVYEQMEISLRAVTGIQPGPFQDFQIAAICKEVKHTPVLSQQAYSLAYHKPVDRRPCLYTFRTLSIPR